MGKQKTKEELGWINQTFKKERLIARDDGERYFQNDQFNSGNGLGGDSTLKLNVFKSLKALAGDDDSLFVILDDRDDPW